MKPKAVAGVLDIRPIELLDDFFDACARLPRRFGKPAGEIHVVLGFELFEIRFEPLQIFFKRGGHTRHLGIKNQTSGSHSSRAYGTGRSSINTSVASAGPTSSNSSRRRGASLDQNRAR